MECKNCKRTDVKCCNTCYSKQETCEVLHFCGVDCEAYQPRYTTNADRIRSMTDEELAKFLEAVTCETHGWCDECKSLLGNYCHGLNDESNSLVQERLKWLKSEVRCE